MDKLAAPFLYGPETLAGIAALLGSAVAAAKGSKRSRGSLANAPYFSPSSGGRQSKRRKVTIKKGKKKRKRNRSPKGSPILYDPSPVSSSGTSVISTGGRIYSRRRRRRKRRAPKVRATQWSSCDTKVNNYTSQKTNLENAQAAYGLGTLEQRQHLDDMLKCHVLSASNTISELTMDTLRGARMKYKVKKRVVLKNNYNYKVKLYVWDVFYRKQTTDEVNTVFDNALVESDIMASGVTNTTFGVTPKDGRGYLKEMYKFHRYQLIELPPGGERILTYTSGIKYYSQEIADDVARQYLPGMHCWFVIQQGTLAHDSVTTTLVGYTEGKIDVHEYTRFNAWVGYNGDYQNFEVNNNFSTFAANKVHVEHTDHGVNTAIE